MVSTGSAFVKVESYDLHLDFDFEERRYSGRVDMSLRSEGPLRIDAVDLVVDSVSIDGRTTNFVYDGKVIDIPRAAEKQVSVEFSNRVSGLLTGLYDAKYEGGHMFSTQFEAVGARRMFPCIDHPAQKAKFRLTIKCDPQLSAISNMPVESEQLDGSKKLVSFAETPRMSTYLLYLGLGKFNELRSDSGVVPIILACPTKQAEKGKFALDVAKKVVEFYSNYFGIPYDLPKLHLIAVPEFGPGAMENWGAITFREAALLIDENSSELVKHRVANVIAHEIAHQWFGDLVTMEWWDDIWLNESFATYMSHVAIDALYPSWDTWEDFVQFETSGAFSRDSYTTTHPIHAEVHSPEEIEEVFDDISYGKGASVLRMIVDFIGEQSFRRGVSSYLKKHAHSNAGSGRLWEELEEASGKPVSRIMSAWVLKSGHPVVAVERDGEKVKLTQSRFTYLGNQHDTWPIPFTYYDGRQVARLLLEAGSESMTLQDNGGFKANASQAGFYRVKYSDWRGAFSACLDSFDRWGVLQDAFAQLMQGTGSLESYAELTQGYLNEQAVLPANLLSRQLDLLQLILPNRMQEFSKNFHRRQLELRASRNDENNRILKGLLAGRLAKVDPEYALTSSKRFANYSDLEPDMRSAALVSYALTAKDVYRVMIKMYEDSDSDEEKTRILEALLTTPQTEDFTAALSLILSEKVKRQDVSNLFVAAAMNPHFRKQVFEWLKSNLERLRELYRGTPMMSRVLEATIPPLGLTIGEELEGYVSALDLPEAVVGVRTGLERLQVYRKVKERYSES